MDQESQETCIPTPRSLEHAFKAAVTTANAEEKDRLEQKGPKDITTKEARRIYQGKQDDTEVEKTLDLGSPSGNDNKDQDETWWALKDSTSNSWNSGWGDNSWQRGGWQNWGWNGWNSGRSWSWNSTEPDWSAEKERQSYLRANTLEQFEIQDKQSLGFEEPPNGKDESGVDTSTGVYFKDKDGNTEFQAGFAAKAGMFWRLRLDNSETEMASSPQELGIPESVLQVIMKNQGMEEEQQESKAKEGKGGGSEEDKAKEGKEGGSAEDKAKEGKGGGSEDKAKEGKEGGSAEDKAKEAKPGEDKAKEGKGGGSEDKSKEGKEGGSAEDKAKEGKGGGSEDKAEEGKEGGSAEDKAKEAKPGEDKAKEGKGGDSEDKSKEGKEGGGAEDKAKEGKGGGSEDKAKEGKDGGSAEDKAKEAKPGEDKAKEGKGGSGEDKSKEGKEGGGAEDKAKEGKGGGSEDKAKEGKEGGSAEDKAKEAKPGEDKAKEGKGGGSEDKAKEGKGESGQGEKAKEGTKEPESTVAEPSKKKRKKDEEKKKAHAKYMQFYRSLSSGGPRVETKKYNIYWVLFHQLAQFELGVFLFRANTLRQSLTKRDKENGTPGKGQILAQIHGNMINLKTHICN